MMTARSLAVRAFHAGSAAAAAAIARRVSAAPMLGIEPSLRAVAGFFTSNTAPLSAAAQAPSMKHSSRSNSGSFRCMATGMALLLAFENGRDAHAPCRTDRDQPALAFVFIENFCQGGDYACPGCREWMPDSHAASLDIELRSIDGAERARESEFVAAISRIGPGLEGTKHLPCECLVYFIEVEVLQRQLRLA